MRKILFDIETDGLDAETVWCLVLKDLETGTVLKCVDPQHLPPDSELLATVADGVRLLDNAELLCGHNIVDYDLPQLRKLFPWAKLMPPRILDTLVLSKLCYPDIKMMDFGLCEKWHMPKQLIGRHSLEAWGHRLGLHKIDYKDWCKQNGIEDPWSRFTPEMLAYCVGDIELNHRLFLALAKKRPPRAAVDLEMQYAAIAFEMECNGFPFNIEKAKRLYSVLVQRRAELMEAVRREFADWWAPLGEHTVTSTRREKVPGEGFWRIREKGKTRKADLELLQGEHIPGYNAEDGFAWWDNGRSVEFVPVLCEYAEGSKYTKIELREFNPSSRDHIADRLIKLYGWKPKEFGRNGKPTLDDEMLADLPFPPCKLLAEYFMVMKRIGQLAEGQQAWLKLEQEREVHGRKAHRIHGRMNTIGTVTFRCAHNRPNMAQVPSVHNAEGVVPYGRECRELFGPEQGFVLVGCDASGLQLRGLAHNLRPYDSGQYVETVTTGDVHTANRDAAGLDTRDRAKRFIYAFLFGAGGWKLGVTAGGAPLAFVSNISPGDRGYASALRHLDFLGLPPTPQNIADTIYGFNFKDRFLKRTPGLKDLIDELQREARANKAIVGLDGRGVPIRSPHAALNSKLMSEEAIICKQWKVLSRRELEAAGLKVGVDFCVHGDVHDEWQVGARPEIADDVGKLLADCVRRAGVELGYECPLAGEFKVGADWSMTH